MAGLAAVAPGTALADTCQAPWGDYSPCQIEGAVPLGGTATTPFSLHITNLGNQTLTWVVAQSDDPLCGSIGPSNWASFSPFQGQVPVGANQTDNITVTLHAQAFGRGLQQSHACVVVDTFSRVAVPLAMAVDDDIFASGFETGDPLWSATASDGGDLSITPGAAMSGAQGLQALVNDTNPLYVEDDTPNNEPRYRARFAINPHDFDPGEAQGHLRTRVFIAFTEAPTRRVAAIVLRRSGGAYALTARARNDDGAQVSTAFFPITDAPHSVEIDLLPATSGANGSLELWIDGVSQAKLTGLTNSLAPVDFVRMGALSVKTGASGTLYFDAFRSRRQVYIGDTP